MYWNTVSQPLREMLEATMNAQAFNKFRLVGGTALSLQLGHRKSVDIDLFTDAAYESIDFRPIGDFFESNYDYVDSNAGLNIGMGASWFVGNSEEDAVKVDIYYTEPFIRDLLVEDSIRMSSLEDIVAMKLEIIGRGGRKKDFWDLHALHDHFSIDEMINFYLERNDYGYTKEEILAGLVNFSNAEDGFEPICLLGKHWELIKLDFTSWTR